MSQAHRDSRPNIFKWFVITNSSYALASIGVCMPYPLISAFGSILLLLFATFGSYTFWW